MTESDRYAEFDHRGSHSTSRFGKPCSQCLLRHLVAVTYRLAPYMVTNELD